VIDTVRLNTTGRPTDEQFRWYWRKREDTPARETKRTTYFFNPDHKSGIVVNATYRPQAHEGPDQLLLVMSLPKVVFGNNWTLLFDLGAAVQAADDMLRSLSRIFPPLPSIADMVVSRLDACYNYPVGDLLPYYIAGLGVLDHPHRTRVQYKAETVEFVAKTVKSKFYDKHAESKRQSPPGLLRHEVTLHKTRAIKEALGLDKPLRFSDLTADLLKYLLERDQHRLGIFEKSFASVNRVARKLVQEFGPNRGGYRYMVLNLYQRLERAQICEELSIDRNTLNRLLAEIRKTGISLALSENDEPLPPLEVVL